MNKKATPPLPETPIPPVSSRPLLSDKNREKYLKALNELVGSLSINTSRPVDVEEFCQKHELKASFFEALRDLDALVFDFTKTGIDETYYKATEKLVKITPEQLVGRMRGLGGRADRTRKGAIETEAINVDYTIPSPATEGIDVAAIGIPTDAVVAEESLIQQVVQQSEVESSSTLGGPIGSILSANLKSYQESQEQNDFAALDYLAERLSVIADLPFDFSLFYKKFPGQGNLIRFLVREGMLLELDYGKYPLHRITHKLMAAIQQRTLHPVIVEVEPQTTEPVAETTEAPEKTTPPANKLKCMAPDCSAAVCQLCWDDPEKRCYLTLPSQLVGQSHQDPNSHDAVAEAFDKAEQEAVERLRQPQKFDGSLLSGFVEQTDPDSDYNAPARRLLAEMQSKSADQNSSFGQHEMISRGVDFAVLPLQHPYNIDIEAHDLRLNMNVSTTEDAAIVDAITFKLKRQTVAA